MRRGPRRHDAADTYRIPRTTAKLFALFAVGLVVLSVGSTGALGAVTAGGNASVGNVATSPGVYVPDATITPDTDSTIEVAYDKTGVSGDVTLGFVVTDGNGNQVYPETGFDQSASLTETTGVVEFTIPGGTLTGGSYVMQASLMSDGSPVMDGEQYVGDTGALTVDGGDDSGGSDEEICGAFSGTVTVGSKSLSIVEGTGAGDTTLASSFEVEAHQTPDQPILNLAVRDSEAVGYELQGTGVDGTTVFKIDVVVDDAYDPQLLLGAGNVDDDRRWSATDNGDGTRTITVYASPIEGDFYDAGDGYATESDFDGTKAATTSTELELSMATYQGMPCAWDGAVIATDAQGFGTPIYIAPANGGPRIDYDVQAPHFRADETTVNQGFFEIFLPNALLSEWGNPAVADLDADFESTSSVTANYRAAGDGSGVWGSLDYHYSSGTISVGTSSSLGGGSGGSGSAENAYPGWEISNVTISDLTPTIGQEVTLTYEVTNVGGTAGTFTGIAHSDWVQRLGRDVLHLEAGESAIVTVTTAWTGIGDHRAFVDSAYLGTVTVERADS